MKIVAISDLHGYLIDPDALNKEGHFDVLCICGDIIPLNIQSKAEESNNWFNNEFVEWCDKIDCDKIIFIAGNHDRYLEKMLIKNEYNAHIVSDYMNWSEKLVFLHDSSYVYKDKWFYGTPWCPNLYMWAFYGDPKELKEKFSNIPDCDVLISHTPGRHMFDTGTIMEYNRMEEVGSSELTEAVMNKKIGLWLCGHIHSGCHTLNTFENSDYKCCGMKVANVSLLNESYSPSYSPLFIEI